MLDNQLDLIILFPARFSKAAIYTKETLQNVTLETVGFYHLISRKVIQDTAIYTKESL